MSAASRRLLLPVLMTAAMLCVTVGLGSWQLQRLEWKRGLLAEIDRGETERPSALGDNPAPFHRVVAEGRFLPPVANYGAEVRATAQGAALGTHLLSLLERPGAIPVLIDRGWAPPGFDPAPPAGWVRIEGYVRPPEHPVRFGAKDDPVARQFYALDPAAIGAALGVPLVAPFTVVALGPGGGLPEPAGSLPRPANNHLSYALTWFGLAAALMVVFAVYVRQTTSAAR